MELNITLLVVSIIFFVAFIILSFRKYSYKYKNKYNIKNMFPYELNYEANFNENLFGNIALILSSVASIAFYIFMSQKAYLPYASIIILVVGILYIVLTSLLIFMPLKHIKLHLFVSLFSMVFTFALFGVIGYVAMDYYQHFNEVIYLVLAIISLIICLFYFGVSMNPKLNDPLNYVEEKNDDGTITYKRPKYFVLAFSQWLCIFANIAAMILTLVVHIA